MKSKSEIIMHSFAITDILSPGELDFITVSVDLWRWDDRVKNWKMVSCFISPLRKRGLAGFLLGKIFQNMMKCLFHLSILDLELMLIPDREPLRTTVELMSWQEWDLKWRLLHDIEFLSFIVRLSLLQHADIHDTSRDTSSCDDHFATIGRETKSLPSEDELVDGDVFEYLVFWHRKIRL